MTERHRLPNRRRSVTEGIEFLRPGGMPAHYVATIGLDDMLRPREIFLSGAKAGTEMASILGDAAVVLSVALQCGVPAHAMARSMARIPSVDDGPATEPASVIGAALDLLCWYESERVAAKPARHVEPGHSWAFTEHRSLAEIQE